MATQDQTTTSPQPNYYHTNPSRRSLLGHISLGVRSYHTSKAFYTATFSALGVSLVHDDPVRKILGYGFPSSPPIPSMEIINIFERGELAQPPGLGTHIAFNAKDREAVIAWWEEGVKNGGGSNGEPGVREHYGKGYFAAFLVDPDGFRLEAVVHEGDEDGM